MFDIQHFEDIERTRLSYYAEYYCAKGVRSNARKDIKAAIEALWNYGLGLEAEGLHYVLQMAGRI